ncbi:hypothetical protein FGRMN_2424 [Fusarium graminum]|nr:hypothetical protein FGRMN_2424 [Fusarium graminum]
MAASLLLLIPRTRLSRLHAVARYSRYSKLVHNSKEQILHAGKSIPKNYERLSLEHQIIVHNRLRSIKYTPPGFDEVAEQIDKKPKLPEAIINTAEGNKTGVGKIN